MNPMNSEEFTHISSHNTGHDYAELRGFRTLEETLSAIVTISSKHFAMNASYVSQILHDKDLLQIVAFHSDNPALVINTGSTYQLKSTYCNAVAVATNPVVIEDTHTDPTFQHVAVHDFYSTLGSFVGVPIVLGSNFVYGTLCIIDTQPQKITADQTALLVLMGRLLATSVRFEGDTGGINGLGIDGIRGNNRFNAKQFVDIHEFSHRASNHIVWCGEIEHVRASKIDIAHNSIHQNDNHIR